MKLKIGDSATLSKTFTQNDVKLFSKISLDVNPIHLDECFAAESIFGRPICHGFLTGSLISAVIANQLPGIGSIYLGQNLSFKKPVFHNDTITARVEIIEINEEKKIVKLSTVCKNQNDENVIEGEAVLKVPNL